MSSKRIAMLIELAAIVAIVSILVAICGWCWTYSINHWLAYIGSQHNIHLWQGCLIGLVPGFGQCALPVAVVTWLLSLFAD